MSCDIVLSACKRCKEPGDCGIEGWLSGGLGVGVISPLLLVLGGTLFSTMRLFVLSSGCPLNHSGVAEVFL